MTEGEKLKILIKQKGYSQSELADIFKRDPSAISRDIKATILPPKKREKYLKVLGLTYEEFLNFNSIDNTKVHSETSALLRVIEEQSKYINCLLEDVTYYKKIARKSTMI